MTPILKLPDHLINQIAAGEVVENPASAIKELVENSLDAGATHIDIGIKAGGFLSIYISDNGSGIPEEEVELAFVRHTTSKLKTLDDLMSHTKMGFRGEALASIASCSNVVIKTSTQDGAGLLIELLAGVVIKKEKISFKKGTTLEIKDLFYNTPARKKFQKSATISTSEIQKMVQSLILSHPKISFSLKADQTQLLEALIDPSFDFKKAFKKRIYDFFSHLKVEAGLFLEVNDPLVSVFGYLAPFESHTNTRRFQYFIVNGRAVDAPSLSYAISDALKTYLPEKRFFQGVFHIDIDPKWIDINVHPQKKEIKFQEESYIRDVLRRLVTPANKEPVSFQKLEPVPLFNYEFKKPLSAEPLDLQIAPRFSYIKTIGYYPPYLLIDSEELDDPQFKKGLVFFDVKSAYTKKHTSLFLDNQLTLCSQGLLIAHPLKLAEADKKLLKNHQKFFDSLGINLNSENELVAHPQDLDIFSTIELIHIAITQLQKGLSEAQISLLIFEFISKYKRIDLEQAYRLLAHFTRDKIKDDHLFCVVSETKLKQLFYDKY